LEGRRRLFAGSRCDAVAASETLPGGRLHRRGRAAASQFAMAALINLSSETATPASGTMCIKQSFRRERRYVSHRVARFGLIGGWFVASQGVNNSGASAFRPPPPQIFRQPVPCAPGKRSLRGLVSPEILNRFGAKAVYTAVLVIDRCPNHPESPGYHAPVGQGVAAGVAEHVRVRFSSRPRPRRAARSIIRAKPAVVNGVPRSLTKTKGDGLLSRCSRRSARSSSP